MLCFCSFTSDGPSVSWLPIHEERPVPDRSNLGPRGEGAARARLEEAGYRILATNYLCRAGEIDIVAAEGGDVVFVEVRSRRSADHGTPSGTVDRAKWRRMRRAADHFLLARGRPDVPMRYDIVSIVWPPAGEPQIDILKGVLPEGRFLSPRGRRRRM
jgi:putative endonuclease